jgi:ribosomal protein S24E
MNLQILHKIEEPLLFRKSLRLELSYDTVTPSRIQIKKELAKQFNSPEECVIVTKIKNQYGKQYAIVDSLIYEKADYAKKIETANMQLKHMSKEDKEKVKEEKKAAKQAAAAKAPKKK